MTSLKKRRNLVVLKAAADARVAFKLQDGGTVHLDCRSQEFTFDCPEGERLVQNLKDDLGWQLISGHEDLAHEVTDPFAEPIEPSDNHDEIYEGPEM